MHARRRVTHLRCAVCAAIVAWGPVPFGPACHGQTEREFAELRTLMVENDVAAAGVKDRAILAVMRNTPRHEFVPPELRPYAYFDMALPIGHRQTISPPFVVASMTQQLALQPADKVLEVGTGSGYQAAILSRLVSEVYTIEIVEPLAERARATFARLGLKNIHTRSGDGYLGWPQHAPFDKIVVTCSPEQVPPALADQLAEGGRMVIPLGERYQQLLCTLVKRDGKLAIDAREPTCFVPMTGQAESARQRRSSEPLSPLANADFERVIDGDIPAGWYYLRQATLAADSPGDAGTHSIAFANRVPGLSSQALQAIGIDGGKIQRLEVELWVRASGVRDGEMPHQQARLLLNFFDAEGAPVGQVGLGPWRGSFDWSRQTGRLAVPDSARTAVVALGLLGATGELSCDALSIRAAAQPAAAVDGAARRGASAAARQVR
jgi:protein-L-isoaspartate(D-aspartate) O-methyltransferase